MQLESAEQEILLDVLRESITKLRKDILSADDEELKRGLRKGEELLRMLLQKIDSDKTPTTRSDTP